MVKQRVALFGASGTMGFQAFRELWQRRDEVDITILVLPGDQALGLFREYERAARVPPIVGAGVAEGEGLKIVWGDATRYADVAETVKGADWVLNAMACISPMADYHPELARAVNVQAVDHIIRAIESEPNGAERIRYVHTSTVAATGNRPVGIHVGRVGDPLKPSVFDYYALTKIAGERLVLQSRLRHWVSLRMTFIMPTSHKELFALNDPILFHMPLDARMENITDRDAGLALVNCLDIPSESDFWRRVYNVGGGPEMRVTAYDFLLDSYGHNGLRFEACAEREWFATRNFHMQYYEDSEITDSYLHYWRDTLKSYWRAVDESRSLPFRVLAFLARRVPVFRKVVERVTYAMQKKQAEGHLNSPRHWYTSRNDLRMSAFFKSYEDYESISGWHDDLPDLAPDARWQRLDHGYDEANAQLDLADLGGAAQFRGGRCLSDAWDGDLYTNLDWGCAFGHTFSARPYTVLKAGHWCPRCVSMWNGDEQAQVNPFFAQVWHADHDPEERNVYPADCFLDISQSERPANSAHGLDANSGGRPLRRGWSPDRRVLPQTLG